MVLRIMKTKTIKLYWRIAGQVFTKTKVLSIQSGRPILVRNSPYPQVHLVGLLVIAGRKDKLCELAQAGLMIGGAKLDRTHIEKMWVSMPKDFPTEKQVEATNPWLLHQFCVFIYNFTRFVANVSEDSQIRQSTDLYPWDRERDEEKLVYGNFMLRRNCWQHAEALMNGFYQMLSANFFQDSMAQSEIVSDGMTIVCPDKTCGLYYELQVKLLCKTSFCPYKTKRKIFSRCGVCRNVYEIIAENIHGFARVMDHTCPDGGQPMIIYGTLEKNVQLVYKIK